MSNPGNCARAGRAIRHGALAVMAALTLALVACATTGVGAPTIERLTSATYPATQTVDVLDAAPAAGFERIANLAVNDPTGTATRGQLVAQLITAAQSVGANAIIVSAAPRSSSSDLGFNPSGGQIQDVSGTGPMTLTAVAIRYTH